MTEVLAFLIGIPALLVGMVVTMAIIGVIDTVVRGIKELM